MKTIRAIVGPRQFADAERESRMTASDRGRVETLLANVVCQRVRGAFDARIDVAKRAPYLYARTKAIRSCVPKMFSTRFRLYARTCRLISVRTLGNVFVRK